MLVRRLSGSPWLCSTRRLLGEGVRRLRRRSGIVSNGRESRPRGRLSSECAEAKVTGVARGTWLTGFARRTAGGRRRPGKDAPDMGPHCCGRSRLNSKFARRGEKREEFQAISLDRERGAVEDAVLEKESEQAKGGWSELPGETPGQRSAGLQTWRSPIARNERLRILCRREKTLQF